MENASKALLMAAAVLIGVIILSIGVYLFVYFSDYARGVEDDVRTNQIAQFNSQFLSYEGKDLTIYDVISLANMAKDYNQENGFKANEDSTKPLGYITVEAAPFNGRISETGSNNISELEEEKVYIFEEGANTGKLKTYNCTVTVNDTTKLVEKVSITQ